MASTARAEPVECVRVCDLFGAGFYYIPRTEICIDSFTGDTRQLEIRAKKGPIPEALLRPPLAP